MDMIDEFIPNIWNSNDIDIQDLKGKVFNSIKVIKNAPYQLKIEDCSKLFKSDQILFIDNSNQIFLMFSEDHCCGVDVYLEDICGDIQELVGSPIIFAEKVVQEGDRNDDGSSSWTFYKLATEKESVTIRWHGHSSGYYSTEVDIIEIKI